MTTKKMRVTLKKIEDISCRHDLRVFRINGNRGRYLLFTRKCGDEYCSFSITGRLNDRSIEEWEKIIASHAAKLQCCQEHAIQ